MRWRTEDGGWNPYLTGALVGVLAIASVFATTRIAGKSHFLGASTSFVRAAALCERSISPEHVAGNQYFTETKVQLEWQFLLVLGIALGALISSASDKSFRLEAVPPAWEKRFGPSIGKRAVAAFGGGVVAMLGARMADGCPSGHGLSGMMQLSVSGMVALAMFFAAGALAARALYGGSNP